MNKYILSLLLVFAALAVNAQSPNSFSYQAVLRNSDGTIMQDEAVTLQIEILQGNADGSSVYLETHNAQTNSFGLIHVEIGDGTTSDNFSNIDWSDGPYYLSITVNGKNIGVTQLLSVPYAIHARTAETISGEIEYTETDPVYSASAASGIGATDITNWNAKLDSYIEVQNLDDVLTQGNSANNKTITGLADPVNDQDAATKAYVDALEARLAALEEQVSGGDPVILSSTNSDDDATVTLSIQETIINGSGNNICDVHVVVTGVDITLTTGDEVKVFLFEDDIAGPDLLWSTTHTVTAAEATNQLVDIMYDCSSAFTTIPPEMGNQLEIYARVEVTKANCGFICTQDKPATSIIQVNVVN